MLADDVVGGCALVEPELCDVYTSSAQGREDDKCFKIRVVLARNKVGQHNKPEMSMMHGLTSVGVVGQPIGVSLLKILWNLDPRY